MIAENEVPRERTNSIILGLNYENFTHESTEVQMDLEPRYLPHPNLPAKTGQAPFLPR